MFTYLKMPVAAVALALLANCAPEVKTEQASTELAPAEAKRFDVGDTWVYNVNGDPETSKITAVDGDVISGINETTGCEYTFYHAAYGPGPSWKNCGGSTGTQQATRTGSIFPLTVGATESWAVKGSNTKGDSWETTRSCEVKGTARVTVPAGSFDTYHIMCQDDWRVREWWYAPELGFSAISRNRHKQRAETTTRELVSFTPAVSG